MTQENKSTGNQPEKKFRAGAVSATVWLNEAKSKKTGDINKFRTISLQRGYKDKNDEWQNTSTLRKNDLPKAILVMRKAYEYIVTTPLDSGASSSTSTVEEEPVM